jgi:nucleoside-diphosphate-sugar epimerase
MKYLILGSSGQIGAALSEYLRKEREEVVEFDIARSAKEDLRIRPNPLLDSLVKDSDFVFFLAFDVGGAHYLKTYQHSYDFISNNTKIMDVTFEVLRKYRKPFLFASSQMSSMAHSPYGVLKAIGEYFTRSLGGLIVKFWNVYGVERDMKKSHVITDFILKAMKNKTIDMMTNGTEERQFLHAEDASRALHSLARQYSSISRDEPLHITNFEWTSILEIAHVIAKHFPGTKIIPSQEKDGVQLSQRNEPDPAIRKFWQPEIGIEEGIEKIIDHYRENV